MFLGPAIYVLGLLQLAIEHEDEHEHDWGRQNIRPVPKGYRLIVTGVPTFAASKNRFALDSGMRMHPCDAGYPGK
jgi:hypothetical protein